MASTQGGYLEAMNEDPVDISPEFIEENKKTNLVKPRQKFAPYTKAERRKRRAKVYQLHFEQGMPAIRIAEVMKMDRNTINNDIKLLYREAFHERGDMNLNDYLYKQFTRLETQRDRLLSYLEKTNNDVEKQLAIERLVADIDFKLMAAMVRTDLGYAKFWETVIKGINDAAETHKLDVRFTNVFELYKISNKSRRSLNAILEEAKRV